MSQYGSFGEGFSSAFGQQQELAQKNAAMQQQQQLQLTEQINKNINDLFSTTAAVVKANADAGNPASAIVNQIQPMRDAALQTAQLAASKGLMSPEMVRVVAARFDALSAYPASKPDNKFVFKDFAGPDPLQPSLMRGNVNTGAVDLVQPTPLSQPAPQSSVQPSTPALTPSQTINIGDKTITGVGVSDIPPGAPAVPSSAPLAAPTAAPNARVAQGFSDAGVTPIESHNIPVQNAGNFNEAALTGLSPGTQTIVRALANYDKLPKGFSVRSNVLGKLEAIVKQYNPDWDEKLFLTSQRTMNNFADGQAALGIRSFNNAIGHTAQWLADLKALDNFQTQQFGVGTAAANKMRQWMLNNEQDPRVIAVKTDQQFLSTETEKALRGANTSEKLIEEWQKRLDPTLTPQEGTAVANTLTGLMATVLKNYGEQYNSGFRTSNGVQAKYRDPMTFLSPENRQIWDRLSGRAAPPSNQPQQNNQQLKEQLKEKYGLK